MSKFSIMVNILEKNINFGSKLRKFRFRTTLLKKFRIQLKILKISIYFRKFFDSVQNFENLDCERHFRKNLDFGSEFRKYRCRSTFSKKNRFLFKISKISISVNMFEKNSIPVQNFENPDFVQHLWNDFDFGSKFRKYRFRSQFSKRFRLWFKISRISISANIFEKNSNSVQNFENHDFGQHFRKKFDFSSNFLNHDFGHNFR